MPCEASHDIWLLKNWYVDPLEDGTRVPKHTVGQDTIFKYYNQVTTLWQRACTFTQKQRTVINIQGEAVQIIKHEMESKTYKK